MDESWDENMPSNWSVYFMVEDADAAAARAAELGGTILVPPTDAPDTGRFVMIQDPQGAIFSAMRFDGPVDRERIRGRPWLIIWPPSRIRFLNP